MQQAYNQKFNGLERSRAPQLGLDIALPSPPRARKGCGLYLSPLTANDIRQHVKIQLSSGQVVIKRTNQGDFAILRDPNWASKVKALWAKACQKGATPQERSLLFTRWVREAAEKLQRKTDKQMREAVRLVRKILAPRKSSRYSVRRNFVLTRSRSRQPRRSGRTRAPTGEDEDGSDDCSNCAIAKHLSRNACKEKTTLDRLYSVKGLNFSYGGVCYAI